MSEDDAETTPPEEEKTEAKRQPAKKGAARKTSASERRDEGSEEKEKETKDEDLSKGEVKLAELRMLVKDSDSVRRLQTALGTNVTGDFDSGTQKALRAWQNSHGFEGGRGIQVGEAQAKRLFGDGYEIVT